MGCWIQILCLWVSKVGAATPGYCQPKILSLHHKVHVLQDPKKSKKRVAPSRKKILRRQSLLNAEELLSRLFVHFLQHRTLPPLDKKNNGVLYNYFFMFLNALFSDVFSRLTVPPGMPFMCPG